MSHRQPGVDELDDMLQELFTEQNANDPNLSDADKFTESIVRKLIRRRRIRLAVLGTAMVIGGFFASQAILPIVSWLPALTQISLSTTTVALTAGCAALGTWLFSLLWQQT